MTNTVLMEIIISAKDPPTNESCETRPLKGAAITDTE